MDSTRDDPRPGSGSAKRLLAKDDLAREGQSATGQNVGPERSFGPLNEDLPTGGTSRIEPELRGKPRKGSRLDPRI